MILKNTLFIAITLALLSLQPVHARSFRSIIAIPVAPKNIIKDPNVKQVLFRPVNSALIERSIKKIIKSWNKNDLKKHLADSFKDKHLLMNVIRQSAPDDAHLRLLSVQGISTLKQKWTKNKKTQKKQLDSVVIATVEIQLEFNDPFQGLVRLPHTSQFYLQVTESEQ